MQTLATLTSSGLTTATTNYSAGDVLGVAMTFQVNTGRATAGNTFGGISQIVITDDSAVIGSSSIDLYFFDGSVTPAADNAAFNPSDAELKLLNTKINVASATSHGNNHMLQWNPPSAEAWPIKASIGTNTVVAVIRGAAGFVFAGGATSLQYKIFYDLGED